MENFVELLAQVNLVTITIRIVLAGLCGGAIGLERTKRSKEAGIRTHCIIAATSALIMIISKYGFADVISAEGALAAGIKGTDPARIAAQIVSGITFLGAGVIFRNGGSVKGLTTAAGIWATAAAGMAIGAGMYAPGLILTLAIVLIQIVLHKHNIGMDAYSENEIIIVADATPEFKDVFFKEAEEKIMQINNISMIKLDDGSEQFEITIRAKKGATLKDISELFSNSKEIKSLIVK